MTTCFDDLVWTTIWFHVWKRNVVNWFETRPKYASTMSPCLFERQRHHWKRRRRSKKLSFFVESVIENVVRPRLLCHHIVISSVAASVGHCPSYPSVKPSIGEFDRPSVSYNRLIFSRIVRSIDLLASVRRWSISHCVFDRSNMSSIVKRIVRSFLHQELSFRSTYRLFAVWYF